MRPVRLAALSGHDIAGQDGCDAEHQAAQGAKKESPVAAGQQKKQALPGKRSEPAAKTGRAKMIPLQGS